ncbi:hypothetical protein PALA104618_16040 [Paenibacillus larvae]
MLQKLSFVEVLSAVQKKVEENTGLRCYDSIPNNEPVPFYFVEIVGQTPEPSKTMWKEKYRYSSMRSRMDETALYLYLT